MMILYSPRATKPRNRRFPLSILALAAVLEGREDYSIVDGNLDGNPTETLLALMREKSVELLAVTVMPGRRWPAQLRPAAAFALRFLIFRSCGAVTFQLFTLLQCSTRIMSTLRFEARGKRLCWNLSKH